MLSSACDVWCDDQATAHQIERSIFYMYLCSQILDIIERYKAMKKQRQEEELMSLHGSGSFDVPVGGKLADR